MLQLLVSACCLQEMMGHLEAGNASGIEELTRRAASAVVTSPAGLATEVLRRASYVPGCVTEHLPPLLPSRSYLHSVSQMSWIATMPV